jgi:hypothetical protein
LEEIQPDHIRVLCAILQEPRDVGGVVGSPKQTLTYRLPDIDPDRIEDLVSQLDDMRITDLTRRMRMSMTAHGAENLESSITAYGRRFIKYVKE